MMTCSGFWGKPKSVGFQLSIQPKVNKIIVIKLGICWGNKNTNTYVHTIKVGVGSPCGIKMLKANNEK